MSGIQLVADSGELATGTALKTILQLASPANQRVKVSEWGASFKGIANTDAPIKVELLRQTTAGVGGTALTPKKVNSSDSETIQSTALTDIDTTEPASGDVLATRLVHPQGGYDWQAPFGKEIQVPGGTRLAIRVTAGVSVTCEAHFGFSE